MSATSKEAEKRTVSHRETEGAIQKKRRTETDSAAEVATTGKKVEQAEKTPAKEAEKKTSKKGKDSESESDSDSDSDDSDDSDVETNENGEQIVNVDFEFFDPSEIDYHGLKSLMNQTFMNDAAFFNLGEVAELIIAQPNIGSTIKCDGPKSDPYAIMTLLNLSQHKDCKELNSIVEYLVKKSDTAGKKEEFEKYVQSGKTALFINERLINMPPQTVPPLMKMLNEEIEYETEQGNKNVDLKYIVYVSKVYREVESTLEEKDGVVVDTSAAKKGKKKNKAAKKEEPLFFFQLEDEYLEKKAILSFEYRFSKQSQSSDSRRAFQDAGIAPLRKVLVLPAETLKTIQPELEILMA